MAHTTDRTFGPRAAGARQFVLSLFLALGWATTALAEPDGDAWTTLGRKLTAGAAALRPPARSRRTFFDARIVLDAGGRISTLDSIDPALAPLTSDWWRELKKQEPFPRLQGQTLTAETDVVELRLLEETVRISALDEASKPDVALATALLRHALQGVSRCATPRGPERRLLARLTFEGVAVTFTSSGDVAELGGVPTPSPAARCLDQVLRGAHLPAGASPRRFDLAFAIESGPPRIRLVPVDRGLRQDVIEKTLAEQADGLRACFNRAAANNPGLAGRMTFELIVDAEGAVLIARVAESTVASDEVGACTLSILAPLRFPPAVSRLAPPLEIVHPVLFRLEELASAASGASQDAGWTTARSDHFVIYTDGGRGIARRSLDEAERAYQAVRLALSVHFPAVPELRARQTLVVICSGDLYAQVAPVRSNGVFRPARTWGDEDFVIVRLGGFATLRHELVHRFLHDLIPTIPAWLNEGVAQYYEWTAAEQDALTIGSTPRTREAQREVHRLPTAPSISKLLTATYGTFQGPEGAQSYSAAFWLVSSLNSDPTRRRQVTELLQALQRGAEPTRAFARAFAGVDLETLEKDCFAELARPESASYRLRWEPRSASVADMKVLAPADGVVLLARLYGTDRPTQTRHALGEALERQPDHAEAFARRAILALVTGQEDRVDAERAVALDPLSPLAWEALGLALTVKPGPGDRPRLVEVARKLEQTGTSAESVCVRAVVLDALGDHGAAGLLAHRASLMPSFSPCRPR